MTENSRWRPVALSLTVLGAVARLIPHPANFAPVGAASLFAGARLPVWQAYLVPLALMAITDPILAVTVYHTPAFGPAQIFIYGSFLIAVWLGRHLRSTESIPRIGALSIVNSMQFFLLSNFGAWLVSTAHPATALYPATAAGLASCYIAAIPFFGRTLLSDLLFTAIFFGLHAWLSRSIATRERVVAAA